VRVLVTGEKGFIASNLFQSFKTLGHDVVSLCNRDDHGLTEKIVGTLEPCVYRNDTEVWKDALSRLNIDVVVHNAAVVGTDVVALNSNHATLTNVAGTYNICRAANEMKIPVCYMGTTVIYKTDLYQSSTIFEDSILQPKTFYGALKLSGEHIVKSHCDKWMIIRPLFAYGGVGDMNSLMAKSFFAVKNGVKDLAMFLDPKKQKDYMHVFDFCDAVATACHLGLWNDDFNVAAETPCVTGEIVDMMSEISGYDIGSIIQWHPETDYLGNHILSSQKFRDASGWTPRHGLYNGLKRSWESISELSGAAEYNPLMHLEKAKSEGIDLIDFY